MSLILSVVSSGKNTEDEVLEYEFNESGGTIGRRMSNTWVLPDENRHLSGSHAAIEYESDSYYIVDTSTNGVFLNGESTPLGRGNRHVLEDRSQLMMGTFTINVMIKSEKEMPLDPIEKDIEIETNEEGLFTDLVDDSDDGLDPLPVNDIPPMGTGEGLSVEAGSDDPFFEFGEFTSDDDLDKDKYFKEHNVEDSIPDLESFFQPAEIRAKPEGINVAETPEVKEEIVTAPDLFKEGEKKVQSTSEIPDDWDLSTSKNDTFDDLFAGMDDPFSSIEETLTKTDERFEIKEPVLTEKVEPKKAPSPKEEIVEEQEDVVSTQKSTEIGGVGFKKGRSAIFSSAASAFMDGLGGDENIFEESFSEKELFLAGKLLRTALKGTMEVLQSRAEIKNEMRMDMTTIQPIQNNPIKFAVNTDEALKKLFVQKNQSYMKPEQAMNEAFDDIKSHQIAVISGIQASLVSVLKRFEPENLIKRLEKESPISANIPIHRKAKLWDKFEALYDTIESEAEDDFNRLFGQEFAKAYDEQVALLEKQRGDS